MGLNPAPGNYLGFYSASGHNALAALALVQVTMVPVLAQDVPTMTDLLRKAVQLFWVSEKLPSEFILILEQFM